MIAVATIAPKTTTNKNNGDDDDKDDKGNSSTNNGEKSYIDHRKSKYLQTNLTHL